MVPTVPMTPTSPLRVACTSALAPGSTTSMTGTGSSAFRSSSAAAEAVLHATTMAFTSKSFTRLQASSRANCAHLVLRPGAVRVAAGVADVHQVLGGQEVDDGAGDGEPAEAAVEHPDRSIHRRKANG